MKNLLFLLLVAMALCACPEKDPYNYQSSDFIELKKEPCFGFCPVYTFKVDGKGNATLKGERNMKELEGDWSQLLPPEKANALFKAFADANFQQFKDEYTAEVTDLPTTWVTLHLGTERKTIKDYYGAPEELRALEKMVSDIAESPEGWAKASETTTPEGGQ